MVTSLAMVVVPGMADGVPVVFGDGRIALSNDGNADPDDIGALAANFAMIDHVGLIDRLVHCHYNSQVWTNNGKNEKMATTAIEGAARFGVDPSRVFDAEAVYQIEGRDQNILNDHLVEVMEASSPDDPLWIAVGGPFEVVWRAGRRCDPSKRPFVRIVTHSAGNDAQTGDGSGRTRGDVEALGFPIVDIADQAAFSTKRDFGPWRWLENHPDADKQWVFGRMQDGGKADISDAGMVFYLITGREDGTIGALEDFWACPDDPGGNGNGPIEVGATEGRRWRHPVELTDAGASNNWIAPSTRSLSAGASWVAYSRRGLALPAPFRPGAAKWRAWL